MSFCLLFLIVHRALCIVHYQKNQCSSDDSSGEVGCEVEPAPVVSCGVLVAIFLAEACRHGSADRGDGRLHHRRPCHHHHCRHHCRDNRADQEMLQLVIHRRRPPRLMLHRFRPLSPKCPTRLTPLPRHIAQGSWLVAYTLQHRRYKPQTAPLL